MRGLGPSPARGEGSGRADDGSGRPRVAVNARPRWLLSLRGVVRRRVKGEGAEVVAVVEYGSLASRSPKDGDELKT